MATDVTAGKHKVGGHVFRAPLGSTIPTDAVTALASAFIDMGYISEDGVANSNTPESAVQTSKDDTFKLKFISAENIEVQKMVYGSTNVTGTISGTNGLAVTANAKELEDYIYVIEMLANGNVAHRVVIPAAKPSEIGDIVYKDDEVVGYDVTLACSADESGNTHYEYWKAN